MGLLRSGLSLLAASALAIRLAACTSFGAEEPTSGGGAGSDAGSDSATGSLDGGSLDGTPCLLVLDDDFNRASVEQGPWNSITKDNGTVEISASDPFAGVKDHLLVTIPSDAATGGTYLTKSLESGRVLRYAFALRGQLAPGRSAQVNAIDFTGLQLGLHLVIEGPSTLSLQEQNFDPANRELQTYPIGSELGSFHSYELTLSLDPPSATAVVTVDGIRKLEQKLKYAFQPGPVQVRAGVTYAKTGSVVMARVDDITICRSP